jgi:uncharacterized membrane protein YfcA
LNVILIPFLGAVGTAIAAFVSQLVMGVLQYLEVRYVMKHHLAHRTWMRLLILASVLGGILALQIQYNFHPIVFIGMLGFVWLILIFGLKIIDVGLILKLLKKDDSKATTPVE